MDQPPSPPGASIMANPFAEKPNPYEAPIVAQLRPDRSTSSDWRFLGYFLLSFGLGLVGILLRQASSGFAASVLWLSIAGLVASMLATLTRFFTGWRP
jgi:hypothetical protein